MVRHRLAVGLVAALSLAVPASAQDECSTAVGVTLGSSTPFDTSTATPSAQPWICDTNTNNDVWFSFTPAADGAFRVDTCPADSYLAVYAGSCAGLVPIGCDSTRCRIENNFDRGGVVNFRGNANQTVYFRVAPTPLSGFDSAGTIQVSTHVPPVNDECIGATPIVAPSTTNFDTFEATRSLEPGGCSAGPNSDLWFRFVPGATAQYQASTCGSSSLTAVEVYQGDCGMTQPLGCSTSACSNNADGIQQFTGIAGTTYMIRVFGRGPVGTGSLDLLQLGSAPNDECIGAQPIVQDTVNLFDTRTATTGSPWTCASGGGPDLWYSFTPQSSGLFTAWSIFTDYSSALEVFTGACGNLVQADCDAGALGAGQSRVEFVAYAGVPTYLRVGGVGGSDGTGDLRIFSRPRNDECFAAKDIALDSPVTFENSKASASAEPWTCGTAQPRDTWYRFTPTVTDSYRASTCGSPGGPLVEVYDGTCGNLSQLACNIGQFCPDQAAFFDGVAGTTYYLRVGGVSVGHLKGTFEITLDPRPGNDECTTAMPITTGTTPYDTTYATASTGSWGCFPTGLRRDVFFDFTPAVSGRYKASSCGSAFDSMITVHQGPCGSLANIGCAYLTCAPLGQTFGRTVFFDAIAGTTYLMRVASTSSSIGGPGVIDIDLQPAPVNDECVGATTVFAGTTLFDSSYATESGPAWTCGSSVGGDVWFRYSAPQSGQVDIGLCESDFFATVQLFEGSNCGNLTQIDCNAYNNYCSTPTMSRAALYFSAVAGQDYLIRVGGQWGSAATGVLEIVEGIDPTLAGTPYCTALPNSTGNAAALSNAGSTSLLANNLELQTDSLPANVIGYYLVSRLRDFNPLPAGTVGNLCLGGAIGRLDRPGQIQNSGPTGEIDYSPNLFGIPHGQDLFHSLRGQTWHWQLWYRDVVGGQVTSNFSNGLSTTLQ